MFALRERILALPATARAELEPLIDDVLEQAEFRGRVMALWSVAFLGSTPIGGPVAGWVSEQLGGREVALASGDEVRHLPTPPGQPVAGVIERLDQCLRSRGHEAGHDTASQVPGTGSLLTGAPR